jgi:hypothetical protein
LTDPNGQNKIQIDYDGLTPERFEPGRKHIRRLYCRHFWSQVNKNSESLEIFFQGEFGNDENKANLVESISNETLAIQDKQRYVLQERARIVG